MIVDAIERSARALSTGGLWLAGGLILAMIGVTLYEVCARYLFNAPTIWAFDLAWMLNGTSFMLAAAYTLRTDQHVAIDVFSAALPLRVRMAILAAVFLFLFLPALYLLAEAAWQQSWRTYVRGEIERVSAWQPLIWPFHFALAMAITVLMLETAAQALKAVVAVARGRPAAAGPADDSHV